jgi:putative transcriptional regulator
VGEMIRQTTSEEIEKAARADPDALPLTDRDLKRMKQTPRVKFAGPDLTQEDFAERYRIPLGTLRDWEQGGPI